MKKYLFILLGLVATSAIILDYEGFKLYQILISLTSLGFLAAVLIFGEKSNQKYIGYVAAGIAFCAVADFIPYFTGSFVWEISAYIVAKAMFSEAFRSYRTLPFHFKIIGILSLFGFSTFLYLSSAFGEYLVPLGLYLIMMIYMSWTGIALHKSGVMKGSKYILYAIIIWFLCEIISGLDRFGFDSVFIGLSVHISYLLALGLVAYASTIKNSETTSPVNDAENSFKSMVLQS